MVAKQLEMFYFDDRTFIALCRQLEKELRVLKDWSGDHFWELRLAYEKFELFLAVYLRSKAREDIDYKPEVREVIAMDLNELASSNDDESITADFRKEKFNDAREKLLKVIEDILYQIRIVTI